MKAIDAAANFSNEKLTAIRQELEQCSCQELVVTCGSYARRDASPSSDMDYFTITADTADADAAQSKAKIDEVIQRHVKKPPSKEGAFAADIKESELLANYGGIDDSNATITRRMLYLLEGEYLTKETGFRNLRRKIIERYVNNTPGDHQIAFYLLNDLIRYWRTLAVDYADKTYGRVDPKPWAVRNIKLIFSRKLIYASGLFSVALTANRRQEDKINVLEKLFEMSPLNRLDYVAGDASTQRIYDIYGEFIEKISDQSFRTKLDNLTPTEAKNDTEYRRLKNEGHYFSRELMGLFEKTFHSSHPIHMAVIF